MGVYFSQTSVIFLASDLADVRIIEVSVTPGCLQGESWLYFGVKVKGMIKGRRESKPKKSLELPKNQTNPGPKILGLISILRRKKIQ